MGPDRRRHRPVARGIYPELERADQPVDVRLDLGETELCFCQCRALSVEVNLYLGFRSVGASNHPLDALYRIGLQSQLILTPTHERDNYGQGTLELFLVAEGLGCNLDDLLAFQLCAARASFMSLERREQVVGHLFRNCVA